MFVGDVGGEDLCGSMNAWVVKGREDLHSDEGKVVRSSDALV